MSPGMAWRTGQRFDPEVEARYVVPGTKLPLYRIVLLSRRTAVGAFLTAFAAGALLVTPFASTGGRVVLGMLLFVGAVGIGTVATLVATVAGVARGVLVARAAYEAQRQPRDQPVASGVGAERGEEGQ